MTDDPGFHPETLSTYEPTPEDVAGGTHPRADVLAEEYRGRYLWDELDKAKARIADLEEQLASAQEALRKIVKLGGQGYALSAADVARDALAQNPSSGALSTAGSMSAPEASSPASSPQARGGATTPTAAPGVAAPPVPSTGIFANEEGAA